MTALKGESQEGVRRVRLGWGRGRAVHETCPPAALTLTTVLLQPLSPPQRKLSVLFIPRVETGNLPQGTGLSTLVTD